MTDNPWMHDRPWIDRDAAPIDAYVASLPRQPDYDLKSKLRQWHDLGFVAFEGVVPSSLIDSMLQDIAHFQRNYRDYQIPIEVRGKQIQSTDLDAFPEDETGIKINHLHCFSRSAALLSLTPEVTDFLSHVFKASPATLQSLTFWRGSQQPIHIDYPYVKVQKNLSYLAASWVALEDVHPDSGPLAYYPGGHKVECSGFFDWGQGSIVHTDQSTRTPMDFANHLSEQMTRQRIEPQRFCARKGDVFIWHGNLPHEGTRVLDPSLTRKSYVTHFTSLQNLPDWMAAKSALVERRRVAANGGYVVINRDLANRRRLPTWVDHH